MASQFYPIFVWPFDFSTDSLNPEILIVVDHPRGGMTKMSIPALYLFFLFRYNSVVILMGFPKPSKIGVQRRQLWLLT